MSEILVILASRARSTRAGNQGSPSASFRECHHRPHFGAGEARALAAKAGSRLSGGGGPREATARLNEVVNGLAGFGRSARRGCRWGR